MKTSRETAGAAGRTLATASYWLITKIVLEKARVTGVLILVVGLTAALLTAVWAVWAPALGEVPGGGQPVERGLNTVLIDKLELWIEEVDGQRRTGLALPARPVFITDDLKLDNEL